MASGSGLAALHQVQQFQCCACRVLKRQDRPPVEVCGMEIMIIQACLNVAGMNLASKKNDEAKSSMYC